MSTRTCAVKTCDHRKEAIASRRIAQGAVSLVIREDCLAHEVCGLLSFRRRCEERARVVAQQLDPMIDVTGVA
jgi:hypothetical protein